MLGPKPEEGNDGKPDDADLLIPLGWGDAANGLLPPATFSGADPCGVNGFGLPKTLSAGGDTVDEGVPVG